MAELALQLGVEEKVLREMTRTQRLPYSFPTCAGLCITQANLPVWRQAVERA
jgi:hypothetical protein